MWKKGQRVSLNGQPGTVVETRHVTPGMVDLQIDGESFVRRAAASKLTSTARRNPRKPRRRRARRNAEDGEKKASRRAVRAKRVREMHGAASRADTSRIESQSDVEQSITELVRRSKGGFFTRADPPRLARDGRAYCGNPIDGVAYYLVVDNNTRTTSDFVKWKEVERKAWLRDAEGKPISKHTLTGQPLTLERAAYVRTLLTDEGKQGSEALQQVEEELATLRGVREAISVGRQGSTVREERAAARKARAARRRHRERKERLGKDLTPAERRQASADAEAERAERDLPAEVVKSQAAAQQLAKRLDELEKQRALLVKKETTAAKFLKAHAIVRVRQPHGEWTTAGLDERLPKGSLVAIGVPSKEWLSALSTAFEAYRLDMEHRYGVDVYPITPTHRKYLRLKKSKRRQKGPRGEDLATTKKGGPAGYEPNYATDYATITDTGELVFWRRTARKAAGQGRFRHFRPYAYRAVNPTTQEPLRDALAKGLPAAAASIDWLVRSGAVSESRGTLARFSTSEVDPTDRISIWLRAKANNPFFSWVPTLTSYRAERQGAELPYSPCLSAAERDAQQSLRLLSIRFRQLKKAFNGVQSLMAKLARDPTSLRPERVDPNPRSVYDWKLKAKVEIPRSRYLSDVRRAFLQLSTAYAALLRWKQEHDKKLKIEDPSAETIERVLNEAEAEFGYPLIASLAPFWSRLLKQQDLEQGMFRLKEGEIEADIADVYGYEQFLQAYTARLLSRHGLQTQFPTGKPEGAEGRGYSIREFAEQTRVSALTPETLIVPMLQWLDGRNSRHPAEGLYAYVASSLSPPVRKKLVSARVTSLDGVKAIREEVRPKGPAAEAASFFTSAVTTYAQGGVPMSGGQFGDPLLPTGDRTVPFSQFDLYPPKDWPVPHRQQLDTNWGYGLVLDDVYPAVRMDREQYPKNYAALEAKELLLLIYAYYDLGGYILLGPLNPHDPCYRATRPSRECPTIGRLTEIGRFLAKAEADLLGGSTALGATDNYTVYMTYNPVLFQTTRLFWPASDTEARSLSILKRPDLFAQIDLLGRFGTAAGYIQRAALASRSTVEVADKLIGMLAPGAQARGTQASLYAMLRPKRDQPEPDEIVLGGRTYAAGVDPLGQPLSAYDPFLLLWPIGATFDEAKKQAVALIQDPLGYLRGLKEGRGRVDDIVSRLPAYEAGLPRKAALLAPGAGQKPVQAVLRGERALDPKQAPQSDEEIGARVRLRKALQRAAPKGKRDFLPESEAALRVKLEPTLGRAGVDKLLREREAAEAEALEAFQRDPGAVLKTRQGRLTHTSLQPAMASGVYDAATLERLVARQKSPQRPPHALPPLLTTRGRRRRGGQAPLLAGQHAIHPRSVIARASEEDRAALLQFIDEGITDLDRRIQLAKTRPKPKVKRPKKKRPKPKKK